MAVQYIKDDEADNPATQSKSPVAGDGKTCGGKPAASFGKCSAIIIIQLNAFRHNSTVQAQQRRRRPVKLGTLNEKNEAAVCFMSDCSGHNRAVPSTRSMVSPAALPFIPLKLKFVG